MKTKAGSPIHCNRNDDIEYHFQCLRMGMWGRRLSCLKNKDMADHFAGNKTHYFTADGRSATDEVLVNIDIDCHHSGSLEGATAFAKHLRTTRFSNLYFEASTNGNGVHGYIVVVKEKLGTEGLNPVLRQFDRWLKAELSQGKWDVENVEVKGHAPEFGWGDQKLELRTYKSGQLAKLPREALARADELRGTTRVEVDELRRLQVPAESESVDSVVEEVRQRPRLVGFGEKERKQTGSISCRHFGDDELARLKGGYLSLAKELIGETRLIASGRKVVTEEDMAVFLMLLRFFTVNMNADGSLPVARWEAMWKALFEDGDIERAWCHHRFARMRNFLGDEKDLIAWEDDGFVIGVVGDDGRFTPGQASKWRACEELMERMECVEAEDVGGKFKEDDQGAREEGRGILYGCIRLAENDQYGNEEDNSILYECITVD